MSERIEVIEPLLARLPRDLGYRRHAAVRDVAFGSGAGRLDALVVTDEPSVLLVEAKLRKNDDAKDKAVGQLLSYAAHFLALDSRSRIEAVLVARSHTANMTPGFWNDAIDDPTVAEMREWFETGAADRLRLVLALDVWNHEQDDKRLGVLIRFLHARGLPVGVWAASASWVCRPGSLGLAANV